jgi:hypothetical protein
MAIADVSAANSVAAKKFSKKEIRVGTILVDACSLGSAR